MAREAVRGRLRFSHSGGSSRASDHGMTVEEQRGVLDEDCVGVVRQVGQADDLEPRIPQRVLVRGMLLRGLARVDWRALEMRELAFRKAGTDGPREGPRHQGALLRTICPPLM